MLDGIPIYVAVYPAQTTDGIDGCSKGQGRRHQRNSIEERNTDASYLVGPRGSE